MATIKLFLDIRHADDNNESPIKVALSHRRSTVYISIGGVRVKPSQWDKKAEKVINHPRQMMMNRTLLQWKMNANQALSECVQIDMLTATQLKNFIATIMKGGHSASKPGNNLLTWANKFAQTKGGSTRTIYEYTISKLNQFDEHLAASRWEDITIEWLTRFDAWLMTGTPSKNARNIHLRNIRAVFNYAIDNGATTVYPFRRYKIRPEATVKRSLTIEQLRELFNYPVEEYQQKYLDIFKLIFYLCGINIIDLCNLKEIINGRAEYRRAKTKRLYSIKVEPEAMEIIEKYRGKKWLLDILDTYSNHKDFAHRLNSNLQSIGEVTRSGLGGKKDIKPLHPQLTTYWARHTWATIAASLDIPKETIAAALGHGGNTVTDIYIDFDRKKVDEANRRVIDYVLNVKNDTIVN